MINPINRAKLWKKPPKYDKIESIFSTFLEINVENRLDFRLSSSKTLELWVSN